MADWYVSSANYTALAVWQATHAYVIGDLIKPTVPAFNAQHVYRCTTAGNSAASEPTWSTATTNNSIRTDGTVTWTNVAGQSTYGWSAAAGNLYSISTTTNRTAAGDRVYLASDHSESTTTNTSYDFNGSTAAFGLIQILSVNRAGSVPPVEADLQSGAAITLAASTGTVTLGLQAYCDLFWQGVTITHGGTPTASGHFYFNSATAARKSHYFKNCALKITNTLSAAKFSTNNTARVTLDNTTLQFGAIGQGVAPVTASTTFELNWINTASAVAGSTFPTTLFTCTQTSASMLITCRGVDLSAITGTLMAGLAAGGSIRALFDSCKIASAATCYGTPGTTAPAGDEIELVNCYDGSNTINERHGSPGDITTDRSTYLSGGAQDDIGNYSLKLVSSIRSDFVALPLECFWFDVQNNVVGASKTATVEIISSGTLNNNDIRLSLEYMNTAGSSLADFNDSLATVLTAASALPSSSVTWNSAPATPQKQQLQVIFTPQVAGRVRGLVRLGKVSTTVWINPGITIT